MTRIVGPTRTALELQDTQTACRYEFVHSLGRGAMGIVHLAKDRETNEHVALKKLLHVDAESILRLKREFRALSNLSHPNLVKLYDLGQDDESWFITMEYLVGEDLLSHVRPEGKTMTMAGAGPAVLSSSFVEPARLVPAFHQLARGVQVLHRAGMLHRDLKPTNVMVDKGRVVVLDFGLVGVLDGKQGRLTEAGAIYGTPAYMAPEQARGEQLREASDWYAFGVMLYEALTGRLPGGGLTFLEIIKNKLEGDPVPPEQIDPNLPASLSHLCMDLLQRDPARRPDGREVLARLEREMPGSGARGFSEDVSDATGTQSGGHELVLVGRKTELAALWSAWRRVESGETVALHVRGISGSGKSALIEHFLDDVETQQSSSWQSPPLLLRSRCYEREMLPFTALDSVMDALVQHLSLLDDVQAGHLLPTDVDALARLFPVLERLRAVRRLLTPKALAGDAVRNRVRAETAFRELFRRVASQSPVLLWIDDLQWGDLDSVRILEGWLREHTAGPVLFLFSYRSSEVETSACLKHLLEAEDAFQSIEVEALPPDDTRALCRQVLGEVAVAQPELVEHIIREADGSPFLALQLAGLAGAQLARGSVDIQAISLSNFVDRVDAMLSVEGREVLQVLSVAGRPMPPKLALRAAGIKRGGRKLVHELRGLNLVRTRLVDAERLIEVYHDRIREAVLGRLDKARSQDLHGALLTAVEFSGRADPEWLHLLALGAGRIPEAVSHGLAAAERAMKTFAFERAAALYSASLRLSGETAENVGSIWEKLAMAFACCGRGADAAAAFVECAKLATSEQALQYVRLAASHYLRSGRFEDGNALLMEVLERLGLSVPKTDAGMIAALLWERCRTSALEMRLKATTNRVPSPESLQRIDVLDTIRGELFGYDPTMAALLQARLFRWALEAGEPQRLVGALSLEACLVATEGSERASRRAEELLARAAVLAERVGTPDARGVLFTNRAMVSWMLGDRAKSFEWALEVERAYRDQPHNERAYFLRFTATALRTAAFHDAGQYNRFLAELDTAVVDARATDNQMALLQLAYSETFADVVRGTPEIALPRLEAQRRLLPPTFGLLRVLHLSAVSCAACSTGRLEWGLELLNQDWSHYLASPIARSAHLALLARMARVRLLINLAVAEGSTTGIGKHVKKDLDHIRTHPSPMRSPVHKALTARIAAITGNRAMATQHLLEAVGEFEGLGRFGDAACARYAYGHWLSGEEGARQREAGHAFLDQQGVREPHAFIEMYYPEVFRSD